MKRIRIISTVTEKSLQELVNEYIFDNNANVTDIKYIVYNEKNEYDDEIQTYKSAMIIYED